MDDDLENASHHVHRGRWEDATRLILKVLMVMGSELAEQKLRSSLLEARVAKLEADDRW